MLTYVAGGKIRRGNEGELVGAQAEIKIGAHGDPVKAPARTGDKHGGGRQRRPATIVGGRAPHHPSGAPSAVGHPNPSAAGMELPAPIMEGGPAPRIFRFPIPTRIGPDPMAAIAIWAPVVPE